MKLLRAYMLRELVIPFCMALLLVTFIFIVGNLVKMADLVINKGVSILDISRIVVLLIPRLLSFTIPTSALTAILLVFGGMAQNNEITAIKASGINIFRMLLPILVVSIVLSIFSLIMNDQILPKTHFAYRMALRNILMKKPLAYIEAGRFIKEFDGYIIFVREIDGTMLKNITIYQPQENSPTRTIIAERGEIMSDPQKKTLSLKLYNGTSDEPNADDPNIFYKLDFQTFILPPFAVDDSGQLSKKTKDMTIDELVHKIQTDNQTPSQRIDLMNSFKAEIHKKISFSFASFVFALIGLPLALITRRGEPVVSFVLSMAVITIYYILFAWANTIAIQGVLVPWIALWLPNVLMFISGAVLMIKVVHT
ncbi:MAG: LptF/LptG family permease [Candidatus Omnitrophica bacterium]|nr:LptF/LptG family permease [Candidatus Omnitrophota bacterium]